MPQPKYMLVIIFVSVLSTICVGQRPNPSPRTQGANGKIHGVLLDANEARIVGAKIIVESSKLKREVKSRGEGDFEIQLPPDSYQIRVEANGFRKFELSPFKVKPNITEMINIHLEVAVISDPD